MITQKKSMQNIFFFVLMLTTTSLQCTKYWDWRVFDVCNVQFPKNFLFSTVTYWDQIPHARPHTTRSAWQPKHENVSINIFDWETIVSIIKSTGLNSYTFSINWSLVEPYQGYFDQAVLDEYRLFCESLVKNNIQPIIILKDHNDPLWWGYRNGWENIENIPLFQEYCLKVVQEIAHTNPIIITFKSPEQYAFNAYYLKKLPPAKKNVQLVFDVLYHQLEAHVRVYNAIKQLTNCVNIQVGITKNIEIFEPWNKLNPFDHISCFFVKQMLDEPFFNWFRYGTIQIQIPLVAKKICKNNQAPKSLDFIGIDHLSHMYMNNFSCLQNPDEVASEIKNNTLYPEGLYKAIVYTHRKLAGLLRIPMYITQNGIATSDETIRDLFFKRYLFALSKAISDGYDVRGYSYWSLFDAITNSSQPFNSGVVTQDKTTKEFQMKEGANYFFKTAQAQQQKS